MIHIGEHETVAAKGENTPFHKKAQNSQNGNQKGQQIDIIEFPHTDLHGDTFTPYARMRLVGLEPQTIPKKAHRKEISGALTWGV